MTAPNSQLQTPKTLGFGVWVLGAGFLVAHLPWVAPSLEDIDSINFALGLREFNPAAHQPHPPGYPVYIAVGRVMFAAVRALRPELPQVTAEAVALSLLSVIAGAIAVVLAGLTFRALAAQTTLDGEGARRTARWATIIVAVSPLFWLTAARPMSDMPGLAAAFGAQALMLTGRLGAGAFVAGVALGIRTQTFWLTAPLLAWLLLERRAAGRREPIRIILCAAAGALIWAVPLVVATGGLEAYLAALGTQAGEDFAFVDMLWANPTPRRLAFGLVHTLVMPWAFVPVAVIVLVLATLGAIVMAWRDHRALVTLVIAFAPYAAFHLMFQETITVRYALPLVAPVAFAAARGFATTGRLTNLLAAPVAAVLFLTAMPGLVAYGNDEHPAFRAIADAQRRADDAKPGIVTSHFELRRPMTAMEPSSLPIAWAPRHREWLELANYWRAGGRAPAWFLANPKRTDLALIDARSRTNVVRYRWAVERRPELSGTRPAAVDWYRIDPPGWFLMTGWSLTAETGGVAQATRAGPARGGVEAYVRCKPGSMHMMIGGRHLGEMSDPAVRISVSQEETGVRSWPLTPGQRTFLEFVEMPDGLRCRDGYTRLLVSAVPLAEAATPAPEPVPVAIRQFDIQPTTEVIFGFGPGWHEDEYAVETGLRWRWASDRSLLRVRGPAEALRVRVRGESPLKYFDAAPTVTLSAAGRVFGRIEPTADFEFDVTVPGDAVHAADGELVLETTQSFVPAAEGGSSDMRRLGLRIFDVRVERVR
jgi:hypothetical protein